MYVCIKLASGVNENEQHIEDETYNENDGLEDALIGGQGEGRKNEDEIHDSDYSFGSKADEFHRGSVAHNRTEPVAEQTHDGVSNNVEIETNNECSDELHSFSSTDEDKLMTAWPKYSKFNETVGMRNPQFKIGMKFRSMKRFKDAVKNYRIKK